MRRVTRIQKESRSGQGYLSHENCESPPSRAVTKSMATERTKRPEVGSIRDFIGNHSREANARPGRASGHRRRRLGRGGQSCAGRHPGGHRMLLRTKRPARAGAAIALIALLAVLAAACTSVDTSSQTAVPMSVAGTAESGTSGAGSSSSSSSASSSAAPAPVAVVTSSPQLGDDALSPVEPVTITVAQGIITALTVTNPEGAAVTGTTVAGQDVVDARRAARLRQDLHGHAALRSARTAKAVPITGTYTTVTPVDKITTSHLARRRRRRRRRRAGDRPPRVRAGRQGR